jgi:hypothetical protein
MRTFTRFAGIIFPAVCLLILGGCDPDPEEKDKPVDSRLVGNWSNGLEGDDMKTFDIDNYGYFSASLNPVGSQDGEGRGTVTGKLTADKNEFIMNKMKGPSDQAWGTAVGMFNGTYIQIEFASGNNTFELKCKDSPPVVTFFGGIYHKQ